MALQSVASRLWLLGWFVALILSFRQGAQFPWLILLFGASGVIAVLFLFFRGFGLLREKRWIEDTPITKIAGAAIGRVKVLGKATGPYTLLSPLSGVDCYYYQAVAWNGVDANVDHREGRATETLFAPFFIEDETGRLMIDPRCALLELPAEYDEPLSGDSMSEGSRRFLRRHGLSTSEQTTVSEYAIKPGDALLVLGMVGENRGLGSIADATGQDFHRMYLSREAAALQRREQLEFMGVLSADMPEPVATANAAFDLHPDVVLRAGDDRQPFILSRTNPQRMIHNLARRSTFYIWAGPALTLFSLRLVIKWLGLG
jgi:hypothetical protein